MRTIRSAIVALVLLGTFAAARAADTQPAATPLPRYVFTVGRQLTYSGDWIFKSQQGDMHTAATTRITVVAHNPDNSYRLIIRTAEKDDAPQAGGASDEEVRYGQLDVTTDGRLVAAAAGLDNIMPEMLPRLPSDAHELATSWSADSQLPGATTTYKVASPAHADTMTITSSEQGIFRTIYGMTRDDTIQFDLAKGMVSSVAGQIGQDYGFKGTGTLTIQLTGDQMITPAQSATLAKDCGILASAESNVTDAMNSIRKSPDDATAEVDKLHAMLAGSAAQITDPGIKAVFDQLNSEIADDAAQTADDGKRIAGILNTAAPDFTAADLAGASHKLSDYRGKVVVLDFWYRGCGWCLRAMPQMKQVVDDFAGKPVVFLGLNTDQDLADAKFVVDAMKLNYPTLRVDQETVKQFHVQGVPAILILDRNGIVRNFDEGYSPTLRTDLDKKIQAVLNASPVSERK